MSGLLYDVVGLAAFTVLIASMVRAVNITVPLVVVSCLAGGVAALVQSGERSWSVLAVAVVALAAQVVLDHVWPRNRRAAELEPAAPVDGTLEPEAAR